MKLTSIEFTGYKRLRATKCNVEGRTVAFIGPNEAGKSSVLEGLDWLTNGQDDELSITAKNRQSPPTDEDYVVRAYFRLEPDDLKAVSDLGLESDLNLTKVKLTEFRFSKRTDGTVITGVTPRILRNPKKFVAALAATKAARKVAAGLEHLDEDEDDLFATLPDVLDDAIEFLSPLDNSWSSDRRQQLTDLQRIAARVQEILGERSDPSGQEKKLKLAIGRLSAALEPTATAAALRDPEAAARDLLLARAPKFVLFKEDDRSILPSYNAADEALRSNVPGPLQNLLIVAETSIEEIWEKVEEGSTSNLRTLQRRINEKLKSKIAPMWTQSDLSIEMTINQSGIFEINIIELDSPDLTITPINERSDGLRTFLALVCFLIARELDVPPILMIDEAERNLHYDAQADLIRVLTRDLQVSKVMYTTHSPGCLPLDLGTGIRVVERDPNDLSISRLQNNFWTDTEPGFSRLLFAMGAEVASFSAFRRAVLAEGVSEMMLLPTLFRNATAQREVDFQIAFGLSNMSAPKALGSVALITVFLVDGDAAGDTKRAKLLAEGVPETHIFQLPNGKAIEDLIDRNTYLDVVDSFLEEKHGATLDRDALHSNENIARAVDLYCATAPGIEEKVSHKIVAFRLAELGSLLKLSTLGKSYLPNLREQIEAALQTTYVLAPAAD